MPKPEPGIGLATPAEALLCPDIERRAAALFSPEDLAPEIAAQTTPAASYAAAQREGRLLVARSAAGGLVGFALMTRLARGKGEGETAHLEEVDVDPDHARRGIGRRLVEAACGWARARGDTAITLTTFRDVAWNAPFYARLGFEVLDESEWSEGIQALREEERAGGLDVDRRVVMRRWLLASDLESAPR